MLYAPVRIETEIVRHKRLGTFTVPASGGPADGGPRAGSRTQLITYDRPGYGGSDRQGGRRVSDGVEDVRAIADSPGLERFAVVGRSGGAPPALACAALLPERVTRTAAPVTLAPWGAAGLDWFDGMAASNVLAYSTAAADPDSLAESFIVRSAQIRQDPVRAPGRSAPGADRLRPDGGQRRGDPIHAAAQLQGGAAHFGVRLDR